MERRLTRSEVPVELTWKLEDIFATPAEWEQELKAVAEALPSVTRYKGRFGEGARVFLECLEAQEALSQRVIRVFSYASLQFSTDGTSPAHQASSGRVAALGARLQAETSFIQTEALGLPDGTLQRYLAEEPGLGAFRRTIEHLLEQKPHVLHPETEMALAALGEVLGLPSTVYQRSKSADMTFKPVADGSGQQWPMSFAGYEGRYERSSDLTLRRNAYASFTEGLKGYQHTYATTWGTEVKKNVVLSRLRRYPSTVHMLVHRQEIPVEVYHSLHDIILKELAPHMRRYARLRKQVLGMDKLLYCDIEAPLDPEFSPATTYEKATTMLLDGLAVLGPEYLQIMDAGLKNRWIDLADNVGKSTGAFCNSVYGVHPYILITWTDSMRNVLTLAHELGHAGHGVLAQRYQRLSNTRSSMFFVEAPSTINELLVADYILAKSTEQRMRRWLIMQLLMTYHHNFVRHLIEGELQRRIYAVAEKGQPVTAALLNQVQGQILEEFWGGEVEIDEGARLTWMRQPHYYSGLYPYSYSAGLTVGTAVARAIVKEGQPVVDRWLQVLKAGGTMKPLQLAELAGVDMTNPGTIRDAVAYVGSLVDEVVNAF